jgi:hypothetical protein
MIMKYGVSIEIDLIEIDKKVPSFNVEMSIVIHSSIKLSTTFNYKSLWFENSEWRQFISGLDNIGNGIEATLADMSSEMKIAFRSFNDSVKFQFEVLETTLNGSINLKGERELTLDEYYILRNGFIALQVQ